MKDITTTPTADLIAEWKQKSWVQSKSSNHQHWRERRHEIIDELNRRCKDAGIGLYKDGSFWYSQRTKDDDENMFAITTANFQQIAAKEQHDLEGWLLLKEGGGNA